VLAQQALGMGRVPRPSDTLRTRKVPPTLVSDVVLCVPSCEGPIRKACDVTGVTPVVATTGRLNEVSALEPAEGFAGAVINASVFPFTEAMNLCRQLRSRERTSGPVILLLDHYQLDDLTFREDLFDDFGVGPFDVREPATRPRHCPGRS